MKRAMLVVVFALSIAACSSKDGDAPPPTPILETPFTARYLCSETRAVENQKPVVWAGHELASDGEHFLLARIETGDGITTSTASLVVSSISATEETDRRVIASSTIFDLTFGAFRAMSEGWIAFYASAGALRAARFDGANTNDEAIAAVQPDVYSYQLAPSASGGWRLAWTNNPSYPEQPELRALTIDANGAATGAPQTLRLLDRYRFGFALSDGALAWVHGGDEGEPNTLFFAPLDDSGALGPERTLRSFMVWNLTFSSIAPQLFADDGGFVLAWPETTIEVDAASPDLATVKTVLWLARLDLSGELIVGPRPLTIGEAEVEDVEPELFEVHGQLGLVWSRGSVIHGCGGCVPDHDLRLVILDRTTLDPLSDPLSISWDNRGGVLNHSTAIVGNDLGIASSIRYHVTQDAALAFARCEPR